MNQIIFWDAVPLVVKMAVPYILLTACWVSTSIWLTTRNVTDQAMKSTVARLSTQIGKAQARVVDLERKIRELEISSRERVSELKLKNRELKDNALVVRGQATHVASEILVAMDMMCSVTRREMHRFWALGEGGG